MKIRKLIILILIIMPISIYANDAQMKETLVQIINQLQSIKPLIAQAKRQQSANPRFKVHFERFITQDGKHHNGLRQDIDEIQQSLMQIVNQASIEPRNYTALTDDYIGE